MLGGVKQEKISCSVLDNHKMLWFMFPYICNSNAFFLQNQKFIIFTPQGCQGKKMGLKFEANKNTSDFM